MNTKQRNVIQFLGGESKDSLVSVDESQITVWVMSCQREKIVALAHVLCHIADAMGDDEKSSPKLVERLMAHPIPEIDGDGLIVRVDLGSVTAREEVAHVAGN
jgi:hypothetical protein